MKNIAIIPARSGSKGLPDKNILSLCGKPLLAYTIEAALSSEQFDVVHVSTDSAHYAEIARQYGADVPFLRSAEASSDTASSEVAIREVLCRYAESGQSFDTFMLLQPTSPLRTSEDIRAAFAVMEEKQADSVISVCETEHSPLWCNTLSEDDSMRDFLRAEGEHRRQELAVYYRLNGAIYLVKAEHFLRTGSLYGDGCYAYRMPTDRSLDIDTATDFTIAGALLSLKASEENNSSNVIAKP